MELVLASDDDENYVRRLGISHKAREILQGKQYENNHLTSLEENPEIYNLIAENYLQKNAEFPAMNINSMNYEKYSQEINRMSVDLLEALVTVHPSQEQVQLMEDSIKRVIQAEF